MGSLPVLTTKEIRDDVIRGPPHKQNEKKGSCVTYGGSNLFTL